MGKNYVVRFRFLRMSDVLSTININVKDNITVQEMEKLVEIEQFINSLGDIRVHIEMDFPNRS